jgi:XTP/dITP diphosphohydrolase
LNRSLKIILATKNPGKVREIGAILARLPVDLAGLDRFPEVEPAEEDGATFAENASAKAVHAWRKTGLVALADDSGLVVDVLGGRPGIRSARFAGERATHQENNLKLLGLLSGVPLEKRTARFICVAALALPTGEVILREGLLEGLITDAAAGTGGFGYDPIFYLPDFGKTVAQLAEATKNRISHRAQAFQAMARVIDDLLART